MRPILLTLLGLVALVGCGGGGGGSAPATPPAPSSPANPPANDQDSGTGSSAPFILDETTRSLSTPAVQSATGAAVLECTVMLREDEFCSFNALPLLGMETDDPTIDDVMARVVVTHDWMATRFREMLEIMPDEILLMMRGLTGVVISSDVRPSFYTARTGAIYLDPAGMWLTEEEEAVISTEEDPRTEDLQSFRFLMLWRYVIGDTDIRNSQRSLASVSQRTAALLFHELAHANDFFPPDQLNTLDRSGPIFDNISTGLLPSTQLANALPLQSSFMRSLAAAAFRGVTPTPELLATTAEEVAGVFPGDVANDYYNYSTDREDLAMAFEEAMMLLTLGIDRDVAVVDFPDDYETCSDLSVAWGQRNRIGESSIGARSLIAVERILPEAASRVEDLLASLPPPTQMTPGLSWCENVALGSGETVEDGEDASRSLRRSVEAAVEDSVVFLPIH